MMLSVGVARADVIFLESFDLPAPAAARFDSTLLVNNWVLYHQWNTGTVTLGQYDSGSALIRTNSENNFNEVDSPVAIYSFTEINGVQSASRRTGIYARLNSTDYSTGYLFQHDFDGANTGFSLINLASNTVLKTDYFDYNAGGGLNYNPNGNPTTMSITLENTDSGVNWTISYGSYYTASGTDNSASQALGGYGTGLLYRNLGNADQTFSNYDNLQVSVVPEPSTWALLFLGLGLISLYKRRHTA